MTATAPCPQVLVVGASSRAASWSCHQTGLSVAACDQFADADLAAISVCCSAASLRRRDVARILQAQEWWSRPKSLAILPAGGMENQALLWRWLQTQGEFWGATWADVTRLRDPRSLKPVVESAGFRWPETRFTGQAAPRSGNWLLKSRHSGGGIQVSQWTAGSPGARQLELGQTGDYVQEYIDGEDRSAVYVAHQGQAWLVGVTQPFTGEPRLGALGWWYCGSWGPLKLPEAEHARLVQLGETLTAEFRLEGIFGVDMRGRDRDWWVLEVNPRYPAGGEVLERSYQSSLVDSYQRARRGLDPLARFASSNPPQTAKGIWFNQGGELGPATSGGVQRALESGGLWDRPVADVPPVGQVISPFAPVFSVFTNSSGRVEAVDQLVAVARVWETLIFATI